MPRRAEKIAPIHPGEILLEECLTLLGITRYRLAKDTRIPPRRLTEIVRGGRSITADTALRLARYFGTSERFWFNLQAHYDLNVACERLSAHLPSRSSAAPVARSTRHPLRPTRCIQSAAKMPPRR